MLRKDRVTKYRVTKAKALSDQNDIEFSLKKQRIGRPRKYATKAQKQAAYRARQRAQQAMPLPNPTATAVDQIERNPDNPDHTIPQIGDTLATNAPPALHAEKTAPAPPPPDPTATVTNLIEQLRLDSDRTISKVVDQLADGAPPGLRNYLELALRNLATAAKAVHQAMRQANPGTAKS
jgi:hypothetical protein